MSATGTKPKSVKYQKREGSTSEHCCVPFCSTSSRYNSSVNFHSFPVNEELKKKWLNNIRREQFTATKHTKVCSRHFVKSDVLKATCGGRRWLKKHSVPVLFQWNDYRQQQPRLGVWERREKPEPVTEKDAMDCSVMLLTHDYCSVPQPAALDVALSKNQELSKEIEELKTKLEEMTVKQRFGFATSDEDIRFYTSYYCLHSTQICKLPPSDGLLAADGTFYRQIKNSRRKE
ncbi:THAP domain-containing protein 2 [Acipenser ruthenus]|uniref:THAP domain-containing protein 2 n=1 Tax=Acipenser ruthenus TaxID=7906 RepID=A0A444UID1_ACIRT|nr:THAP domain-containing protein 2 [Acipenser ruthenus]